MNKNLTEMIIIVDRSGSMSSLREDATGGINELLQGQKDEDGQCNVTLVEFDNEYNIVQENRPVEYVDNYTLVPRGSTALLDAVGNTLNRVGERLANTKETDRPGLVSVVIVTDGMENASREFNREQVADMIKEQQDKYNWQFTYLCKDMGSANYGSSLNIDSVEVYTSGKVKSSYAAFNGKMSRMRGAVAQGVSHTELKAQNQFTDEEKQQIS